MPRMLTPSHSGSLRRSSTSLNGSLHGSSRTSLVSLGSTTSVARRAIMINRYNGGSTLSLRRSSLQNAGPNQSSTSSLRREASRQHQLEKMDQEPSSKNAVWDFFNQASVSKGSFATVSTARSSQSSLLRSPTPSPPPSPPAENSNEDDALQRYYALHQKYMQHRPKNNAPVPVVPTLQRPILHATNSIPRRNSMSFLPPAQIKEEDDAWGHFVETKLDDEGDELKALSAVARKYPASFAHLAGHPNFNEGGGGTQYELVYIFPPCHSEAATDAIGLHELSELQLIDMLST
eukprot:CAMPEP_0181125622 /NCGR_PEP_ID=MMETSP1071-20121207/27155_1 /TAXON_ID=35127 /ORGANISM="Thalassiosira sp., Strain NH16" /LENGTH=290 /DNA_ID=CAMNT_0023211091 /DNA_START=145 /DNA_END=1014 /DNA_ORIENTATION=-